MPLDESLLQRFGALELPAVENSDDDTLTSLDPGRDILLALFAAAINSELGAAWTAVTNTLGADHRLYGTSPVQSTLPDEPTEQVLTQVKKGFPLLALHRSGTGTYEDLTMEITRLTQPWKIHYVLGPLDFIDQRKLKDVCVAVAKIVALTVRERKHLAYESGAQQFEDVFSSIRVVSQEGPTQAGFGGGDDSTIYWAVALNLEATEITDDIEGTSAPVEAMDLILGVGGEEEIIPSLVLGASDAQPGDEPTGATVVTDNSGSELWVWTDSNNAALFSFDAISRSGTNNRAPNIYSVVSSSQTGSGPAFDPSGNLWFPTWKTGLEQLRRFPAGAIAPAVAMNSDRTIECAVLGSMVKGFFTTAGDYWLIDNLAPGILHKFSAAQLASSSEVGVSAEIEITLNASIGAGGGNAGCNDFCIDSAGWGWFPAYGGVVSFGKRVFGMSPAQLSASASGVTPAAECVGSNFDGNPDGVCLDPDGLYLWVAFYDSNAVAKFLLSDLRSGGNPAPVLSITCPDLSGPIGMVFDGDLLWVASYNNGKIVGFSESARAASGAVAASRVLSCGGLVATPWMLFIRDR